MSWFIVGWPCMLGKDIMAVKACGIESCSPHGIQEAEQETGTEPDMAFESTPPASLHILKFPELPKTASSDADHAFHIGAYGELFTFKH